MDRHSDIDLLAVVSNDDESKRFNPSKYSVYTKEKLSEMWSRGNPFAWHLYLEAVLVHSSTQQDYLKSLGKPKKYSGWREDAEKFHTLYKTATNSLSSNNLTTVYDLAMIFLAIRNIATCYSLGFSSCPDFSRYAALRLTNYKIPISEHVFSILEKSKLLSSRGSGTKITNEEVENVLEEIPVIDEWMLKIYSEEYK